MPNIQEAIKRAISIKGIEILKDRIMLCNVLEDLAPDLYDDIAFINKRYIDAIGEMLYKACQEDVYPKENYFSEIDRIFEAEDIGVNSRKRFIQFFELSFGYAYDLDSFSSVKPSTNCENDKTLERSHEDSNLFSVELVSIGHPEVIEKIRILKSIREITGLGLKEATYLYENVPALVIENKSFEEAENVKINLEQYGAKAVIKKRDSGNNYKSAPDEEISTSKNTEYDKTIIDEIKIAYKKYIPFLFEQGSGKLMVEHTPGIQFDCPHTAGGNAVSHLVLYDSNIIIIDKVISTRDELIKLYNNRNLSAESSLLIIANDITDEAKYALIEIMRQASTKWCAVRAPAYGDRRKNMLQDLAIATGAKVITSLQDHFSNEVQGHAASIHIESEHTTLLNPSGKQDLILDRINAIKTEMKTMTSEFEREKQKTRIDMLSSGVLVIKNAGKTPEEVKLTETRLLAEAMAQ